MRAPRTGAGAESSPTAGDALRRAADALVRLVREHLALARVELRNDLRVAAQVCDTVAVMHQGRVVEYGTAAEVFGAPQHDYTRSLFAAAPGRGFAFGGAA